MNKIEASKEKKSTIVKKFMRINTRKFQNAAQKKNFDLESEIDYDDACSKISRKISRINKRSDKLGNTSNYAGKFAPNPELGAHYAV